MRREEVGTAALCVTAMHAHRHHGGYYGSTAHGDAPVHRLFGAAASHRPGLLPPVGLEKPGLPVLVGAEPALELTIAPFAIRKWGQLYVNPETLRIRLERLPATLLRIMAIHNFRMEDHNPRLDECMAAVFLARRVGTRWEEAEDHPIECRGIEVLGYLDVAARRITPP
jgi:hypothetical protein